MWRFEGFDRSSSTGAIVRAQDGKEVRVAESWTIAELKRELDRFEMELRAAELAENSVRTYVDRSERFIRWLAGEYTPRGPN